MSHAVTIDSEEPPQAKRTRKYPSNEPAPRKKHQEHQGDGSSQEIRRPRDKIKQKQKYSPVRHDRVMEYGSFERGDRVARIEPYNINEVERIFKIHWKSRSDGTPLKHTYAEYQELKYQTPFKIIQWWEGMWLHNRHTTPIQEEAPLDNIKQPTPDIPATNETPPPTNVLVPAPTATTNVPALAVTTNVPAPAATLPAPAATNAPSVPTSTIVPSPATAPLAPIVTPPPSSGPPTAQKPVPEPVDVEEAQPADVIMEPPKNGESRRRQRQQQTPTNVISLSDDEGIIAPPPKQEETPAKKKRSQVFDQLVGIAEQIRSTQPEPPVESVFQCAQIQPSQEVPMLSEDNFEDFQIDP